VVDWLTYMSNEVTFNNEFDLTCQNLNKVVIKENAAKNICIVWDVDDRSISYNSFILSKNSASVVTCEISFYKSKSTNKYIPRLTFRKKSPDGSEKESKNPSNIIISINDSDSAERFWRLISFLGSYKDLVDVGDFNKVFKVVSSENYIIEFQNKAEKEKVEELKKLIGLANLSSSDIKAFTFEERKKNLKAFLYLLKNKIIPNGKDSHTFYRDRYKLPSGEEYIWHHFLKKYDWILGLNADLKFIMDFLDEQKVGIPDSKGKGDPQTDLLGISEFTVLVELKHANVHVFKKTKIKGRANTWDFTPDFIEGISQCLGQKFELEASFNIKDFEKEDKTLLDKSMVQSIDPKSILLIGNKKEEFPINGLSSDNRVKNKTLERFRRNNRNIDVLTYDELFERAYHIVYSKKLDSEWYWQDEDDLFN